MNLEGRSAVRRKTSVSFPDDPNKRDKQAARRISLPQDSSEDSFGPRTTKARRWRSADSDGNLTVVVGMKDSEALKEMEGGSLEDSSGSGFSFACFQCHAAFGNCRHLDNHEEKHQRHSICSFCGYDGSSKEVLEKETSDLTQRQSDMPHTRSASFPRSSRLGNSSCPWCHYISQRVSDVKNHAEDHGRRVGTYCNICKYYTPREEERKSHPSMHQKSFHTRVSRMKCLTVPSLDGECREAGEKLEKLLERALYRCPLCPSRPKTESGLRDHLSLHLAPSLCYCPYCSFHVADSEQMLQHVLAHLQPQQEPLSQQS